MRPCPAHTHWIPLSELGHSTSPGENTNIAAIALFSARRAQAPVACVAIVSGSLCRLRTITLNRMEKAGGQRFHAAYSCTFLVAHWPTEAYSALRTRDSNMDAWKCRSLCSQGRMSQKATVCLCVQHTRWIPLAVQGHSTSPREDTKIGLVALFASRRWAQTHVACVAIVSGSLCRLRTITIKRMEKAGGQMFHAAYSFTFVVTHPHTEVYSVTRTRLRYGWLHWEMQEPVQSGS